MQSSSTKGVYLFVILSLLFFSCKSKPETEHPKVNLLEIFTRENNIPSLELLFDIANLLEQKDEEEYTPAKLSYLDEEGNLMQEKIKIRPRGITRKKFCDFPPLKLEFKKELSEFDDLKLVTHCKDDSVFENYLLRELLVYQLYNKFTDISFRVQLAKVKYIDERGNHPTEEKYGFLIENFKSLAHRLNAEPIKASENAIKSIDKEQYNLFFLFQYMIGNTDWNVGTQHNIELIALPQKSSPVPIPYDFDYCGLVNASYAIPHPNLPIKNVRERLFQWRGKNKEELKPVIQIFRQKKEELLSQIDDFSYLDADSKADLRNYLLSFFEMIDTEEGLTAFLENAPS